MRWYSAGVGGRPELSRSRSNDSEHSVTVHYVSLTNFSRLALLNDLIQAASVLRKGSRETFEQWRNGWEKRSTSDVIKVGFLTLMAVRGTDN